MKKALIFGLLAAAVLPLASCGDKSRDYSDKDFDGLYDSIDPTPESNISGYVNNDGAVSKEISVAVDYRKFFPEGTPKYDKDIGVMMAIIANNSYLSERTKWSVVTSQYESNESNINPVLVQFGFYDLKYVVIEATDNKDTADICGIYLGNHILKNNGLKYQVFMASLEGYPSDVAWISNLDLGADTESYYSIDGDHPEWTNKKHHKGFDVTANRAYNEIKKYIDEKADKDATDTVVLVTGHSRGGALTNLVGKKLFDNNIKSLAYAFNGPLTTTEDDEEALYKYTNIFNIHSTSDYIGRYPFAHMGFTSYGNNLEYDFLNTQNANYYKSIYNQEFQGNTPENLDKLDDAVEDIYPTRDGAYEFEEAEQYEVYATQEEANEAANEIRESAVNAKIKNYAKVEVVNNSDVLTLEEYPYAVTLATKPYSALKFASELLVTVKMSDDKVGDVINLVTNGLKFVGKYFTSLIANISLYDVEIDVSKFATPHIQKTCVIGAMVAK
ncbi:MAG: hypothetical protein KBS97_01180 [Firmicutes bacterium]|nr:hypothetical protein [Candidatus Fiminaster equi]